MAHLKDIAKASGVSIRTVNRVLKNNGYVSDEVRARVEAAVQKLGYSPDLNARSLRTGKSVDVAVIATTMDELYMDRMSGLEQGLREKGYRSLMRFVSDRDASIRQTLDQIIMERPAGIVLFNLPVFGNEAVRTIRKADLPYITIDFTLHGVDTVRINRQQGVYESIHYLARQGRERIAYLGSKVPSRTIGYERAIRELGRKPIYFPFKARDITTSFDEARALAADICRERPLPDAVQCYSDVIALGFLAGLHDAGINVPEQMALVGFDDRSAAALSWPKLTTVAQPSREVGLFAATILIQKINGERRPREGWTTALPTHLVLRETA